MGNIPHLCLHRCQAKTVKDTAKSNKIDYVAKVQNMFTPNGISICIIGSKVTVHSGEVASGGYVINWPALSSLSKLSGNNILYIDNIN